MAQAETHLHESLKADDCDDNNQQHLDALEEHLKFLHM